jgi:hypothetical protein
MIHWLPQDVPQLSEPLVWRWVASASFVAGTTGLGFGVRRILHELEGLGKRIESTSSKGEERHERIFASVHEWNNEHQATLAVQDLRLSRIETTLQLLPFSNDPSLRH